MKASQLILLICIALALCGCAQSTKERQFSQGYRSVIVPIPEYQAKRWILMLRRYDDERIISEAIVIDGKIASLSPSVDKWALPDLWSGIPPMITLQPATFFIDSRGSVYFGENALSDKQLRHTVSNLLTYTSNGFVRLEVEIHAPLDSLEALIDQVSSFAGQGMYLAPVFYWNRRIEQAVAPYR